MANRVEKGTLYLHIAHFHATKIQKLFKLVSFRMKKICTSIKKGVSTLHSIFPHFPHYPHLFHMIQQPGQIVIRFTAFRDYVDVLARGQHHVSLQQRVLDVLTCQALRLQKAVNVLKFSCLFHDCECLKRSEALYLIALQR